VCPPAIQPLDQADAARTRIASAAGAWMLGDHMQTARFCADAAIDIRKRLTPYARKSAPGFMAREWADE